jgi:hypothetical protein
MRGRKVQWAALIAWIATAVGGATLFVQWLRHGGLHQKEGIRSPRLFSHLAVAVIGLACWVIYLAEDDDVFAWAAVALLVLVALLGISMFVISSRGRTTTVRTETPAEAVFPVPLVIGHGLLGTTTLILATLAAVGIGG